MGTLKQVGIGVCMHGRSRHEGRPKIMGLGLLR